MSITLNLPSVLAAHAGGVRTLLVFGATLPLKVVFCVRQSAKSGGLLRMIARL